MSTCIRVTALIIVLAVAGVAPADAPGPSAKDFAREVKPLIAGEYDRLEALYKELHAHPELSLQEVHTAARLAQEMRDAGFEVTEGVGGTGIVCVLKNGAGPTVLVRTDMDALPVAEATGLPYSSHARARDRAGNDVGVMHACGHDMHMTVWVGTARALAALRDHWHGTLVFVGQPAEEIVHGARMMLADGLYSRFPKPDYALALHCSASTQQGEVNYREGPALANVSTVDVTVRGRGGHGSAPHTTVDPVVLAARIVLDLQTIISREKNPVDPAVVTVGSIHGGSKHNIIPSEVKLQITVRTTKDEVTKHVLDAIERIAKADALAARAPEPTVHVDADEFTPALVNDAALTKRTVAVLKQVLGVDNVHELPAPSMGGEDFSLFNQGGVPIFMYDLGTIDPTRMAESKRTGRPLPSLHSDHYHPAVKPSIEAGVTTMSVAVLNLVGK